MILKCPVCHAHMPGTDQLATVELESGQVLRRAVVGCPRCDRRYEVTLVERDGMTQTTTMTPKPGPKP